METELSKAIEVVVDSLMTDPSYRHTWKANIAMAFVDEWNRDLNSDCMSADVIHRMANKAADNFLTMLCSQIKT